MRQLLTAFPGASEDALKGLAARYRMGKIASAKRTRRTRCRICRTRFAAAGEEACAVCDPPAVAKVAA